MTERDKDAGIALVEGNKQFFEKIVETLSKRGNSNAVDFFGSSESFLDSYNPDMHKLVVCCTFLLDPVVDRVSAFSPRPFIMSHGQTLIGGLPYCRYINGHMRKSSGLHVDDEIGDYPIIKFLTDSNVSNLTYQRDITGLRAAFPESEGFTFFNEGESAFSIGQDE